MPTLLERVARARDVLAAAGISPDDAALDAQVFARHVLGWDRAYYLAHAREAAPERFEEAYDALIRRRAAREPVSQILGVREFWGREFEVTRDVLAPRPETELVVEEALAAVGAPDAAPVIIDVCTGSGCLAITLAAELPASRVTATDMSEAALSVARRNAQRHGVASRVEFVRTDLVDGLEVRANLIVCNPPYIAEHDAASLPPEVVRYEPHAALFGGPDGLDAYRRLLPAALSRALPGGRLIIEVGYDQHAAVAALASRHGWRCERTRQDLQGIARVVVLARP